MMGPSFSNGGFPSYLETCFSNPADFFTLRPGYSDSTRYVVPVHNPLLLSNRVPGDSNFLSQCNVRALHSLQRHLKPCPPPSLGPFQIQQRELRGIQPATKPEKPVLQPMHSILISYFNYKYNLNAALKSHQEFLNSLHLTVCRKPGGFCKCQSHRLLILHFEKCQDTSCSICGPVRLLCFSRNQNHRFSGGVDSRGYVAQESQPVWKRMRMENSVQNDNWSPYTVTGHHSNLQSYEGPINNVSESDLLRSSKGFGEIEASRGEEINMVVEMQETGCDEEITTVVEMQETGCGEEITTVVEMQETGWFVASQVKVCDESLNSDMEKSDCQSRGKSEDLIQTTLNEEIPCSTGDIGEHLLSCSYDSEDMNLWGENAFSYDEEEINKVLEELEVERADISGDKSLKSDCQSGQDSEHLKASGVSLIDFFTAEQIKEHLRSLNQHTHLGLAEIRTVDENTCQLCVVGGRKFFPPPMYCTCCDTQIKPGVNYYKPPEDVKHSFCASCFRVSRGNISFRGLSFSKAKLEKCKHDDEVLEGWVQCDNCKGWQHQICALYNSKQDSGGDLEYVCPFCRMIEIEDKVHAPIRSAFGAQDLPRTKLSDHIEERLFRSLDKERKRRAEFIGKSPEEVPGAEDLVVRVVLGANKQLKVRQEFLDILHGETYPTEFPYKSKMLMLFQKFEGVDVCIFTMYVQEFGSECGHPNNRSIYISYLDSVKYFRPEIKTVDGVALRTFVYQQILIGYLDYCKRRGFSKCYIWACPPSKGEDYILYCHPETQKTPNPHKLLQWYKKMLKKAKEERVVVEYTNFYDSFFVPRRECNSRITTAKLPYFDGDYWSSAIGNMIRIIDEEAKESKKKVKTKRALRVMGHSQGSEDNSKDMLVMQKLGQVMLPSKEEFFVVHLQFTCSNCQDLMLSGTQLSCNQCSKFHLCHRCAEVGRTHTRIHGERHQLLEVRVNDVPVDTEDADIAFESDLFNERLDFLLFCQDNHYQFDSLRRAKHSTMMILHQLQPTSASV